MGWGGDDRGGVARKESACGGGVEAPATGAAKCGEADRGRAVGDSDEGV